VQDDDDVVVRSDLLRIGVVVVIERDGGEFVSVNEKKRIRVRSSESEMVLIAILFF
jgi:hypothetical protein